MALVKGLSVFYALALATALPAGTVSDPEEPGVHSLLELLNTRVISASRSLENVASAPATVLVVTRKEIVERGYTHFWQIFEDLPGFDLVLAYGPTFLKPYARGFA